MAEGNGNISRENVTIPAETTVEANALLGGKVEMVGIAATAAAAAGNTGTGVMTMANPAVSSNAKPGFYRIVCIDAQDGGKFVVENQKGVQIGTASAGVAFTGELNFIITAGDYDFEAGDSFTVNVRVGFVYVPFDPGAADGAEVPVAYSIYAAKTGVGETRRTAVISRLATLNGECIAWPTGITAEQKANAVQALAKRHIVVR